MKSSNKIIELLLDEADPSAPDYGPYMRWHMDRIQADAELIGKLVPKEASLLDVGAVPPLLAMLLSEQGYTNLSVSDPNIELYESILKQNGVQGKKLDLFKDDTTSLGSFDCVCLCEVLEHLNGDILAILEDLASLVSPEGYLYVTTPNLRSISGLMALIRYQSGLGSKPTQSVVDQYIRASGEYGYFGHVREYTGKEVSSIFNHLGFNLVEESYQAKPRTKGRREALVRRIELLFPRWRLYGKYLFKKRAHS